MPALLNRLRCDPVVLDQIAAPICSKIKELCRFKYRDMTEIRKQLTEELASVEWSALIPHAKRDAVIVVEEGLDLLDVGVAIAKDDFITVESWISEQLIHKPDANELMAWNNEPDKQFMTLILQPFVVVQQSNISHSKDS